MEQEILKLERRVEELKKQKSLIERQRFTYPLDTETQGILAINSLIFTGRTFTTNGVILTDLIGFGLETKIDNKPLTRLIVATLPLKQFTVDATSNAFTYSGGNHYLQNGDIIYVTTTNTLPSPLSDGTTYYVVQRTDTTFKVSTSVGGSEVDITDTGTGTHYYTNNTML